MIENPKNKVLLEFIKKFFKEYGLTPGAGFLAGYFKVTIRTIDNKLEQLEQSGDIKRIKKVKNYTSYEIL